MNKQRSSGSGKLSWRDGLWLALYLSQIGLGASLLGLSSRNQLPAIRLYFSTLLVLGAVVVVVALDLRAFLVSQQRWAVVRQTLSALGAAACFSLLGGNAAVARWLSWALIGLGIVASLGCWPRAYSRESRKLMAPNRAGRQFLASLPGLSHSVSERLTWGFRIKMPTS